MGSRGKRRGWSGRRRGKSQIWRLRTKTRVRGYRIRVIRMYRGTKRNFIGHGRAVAGISCGRQCDGSSRDDGDGSSALIESLLC